MKATHWFAIILIFSLLVLNACKDGERQLCRVNEIMEVDRDFSRLSLDIGAHESFLAYIDDSCVLLRPNRMPVVGRKKIEEMYNTPDTSFTLSWDPISADVSESGDLAYTYGIYTIQMDSPEGSKVKKEGTYVTIWKRGDDGKWKFVMDTGNQGLGLKNTEAE